MKTKKQLREVLKMAKNRKGLVVTTVHKGVFFGYGTPTNESTIELINCRMCIYWPSSVQGVLGLAVTGPKKGSRITPSVPSIILRDITAVMEATPESIAMWEKGIWD